jgi:hypothetical protein
MAQANAIIVRIRADAAEEFERMFEAEELPIWDEFVSNGTFLKARLARMEYGSEEREDVALYLIYAEVPGMTEHSAHDRDPGSRPSSRRHASSSPRARRSSEAT